MHNTLLYLDPGSGSYLLQAIIAAVLGGLMFFKGFWYKIKAIFIKPKQEINQEESQEQDA